MTHDVLIIKLVVQGGWKFQLPFITAWLFIISLALESHIYTLASTSPLIPRGLIETHKPFTI